MILVWSSAVHNFVKDIKGDSITHFIAPSCTLVLFAEKALKGAKAGLSEKFVGYNNNDNDSV